MSNELLDTTEEAQVLEAIVRNQLEIERLTEMNATLKGYFKERPDAYPAGNKKEVGKFYVRVSTNQRVDDALARQYLTPSLYNRLTKKVIDGTLARKGLSATDYEKIVKQYDNRIEVGLR